MIKNALIYSDLFYMLTLREIKIKYKQSIMGFLWALLIPMLVISAGVLLKVAFAKVAGAPFTTKDIASVSAKAIPWAFFASSIKFSTNSLITNFNLVTKINFPKIIFPISAICSQLVDFMISVVFLLTVLYLTGYGVGVESFFAIFLILVLIVQALALGIILSAANLFFRDVKYIVEVIITYAIFFTPVFYDAHLFGKWEPLLLLNPVAPLLEALNGCLVLGTLPYLGWVLYSTIVAFVSLFFAVLVFKKIEPMFAEYI